ncbi:MAG: hypothetical protein Q4C08_00705 [Pseudomonadota bacterium]|nr:hypothetical protein [Pseudomonadota bacterium]
MTISKEDKNILDEVVNALLDENTPVLIETTYSETDKNGSVTLTSTPKIPTTYGNLKRVGLFSPNAHYAHSVKIGKFSIKKYPNGAGFWIRTPDDKESSYQSTVDYNKRAYCVWLAALSKYDNNTKEMLYYLNLAGYKNISTYSNPKTPIYDQAINQLKSLGLSEQDMTRIKKLKDKSNDR